MSEETHRTPGQLIQHLLAQRGWEQGSLALVLGVDKTVVSKLVAGKKAVDAQTAIALGDIFQTEPKRFLDLQASYDLARAQIETPLDAGRADRAVLFGDLPVTEMIRRGWLKVNDVRNTLEVEEAIKQFFGVQSVRDVPFLPHAAKKTGVLGDASPSQLAWIRRVMQIAADMLVPKRYSQANALRAVEQLKTLLRSPEEVRKVPRILAEAGIRFVIVEPLKSAKIDGVCLWLDDVSPVIGISLRFDRIDNFWFVLRHELEHVLRGHGRSSIVLDVELERQRDSISAEEDQANKAASDFCVPEAKMAAFAARKAPFFSEPDVLAFANMLQVHPGLVAGQIQRLTERYDLFRPYLVKIRSLVSPGSVVDGWGDIAPISI